VRGHAQVILDWSNLHFGDAKLVWRDSMHESHHWELQEQYQGTATRMIQKNMALILILAHLQTFLGISMDFLHHCM